MALTEYNRKRNFGITSEPPGEVPKAPAQDAGLGFVIQKHAASRLHYDFRLELDGVLLSWSVPKGPSLDPKVKRLAMHVEDHPLAYADFEGIIPKGQYGGGTVLLWDRGTWEPLEDARQGYRKGNLKFWLKGEKLQGGFALVKIRGRSPRGGDEERSWLLIKERDTEARDGGAEITEARPESVATGRSLEEIAGDKSRVWHSKPSHLALGDVPGAREAPLPTKLRPPAFAKRAKAPAGEDWLHEPAVDGTRALARVTGSGLKWLSATGAALPAATVKKLGAIADGGAPPPAP